MRRPYKCTDERAVRVLNIFLNRYPNEMHRVVGPGEHDMFFQLVNRLWGDCTKPSPIKFLEDQRGRVIKFEIDSEGDTTYLDPDISGAALLMAKLAHIQTQGWAYIEKKCPAEYKLFVSLSQRDLHDTTRFERDEMMACTGCINEALMMRDPKPVKKKK